jgi:hypothetical protein
MSWPDEEYAKHAGIALEILGKLKGRLYQVAGTHDVGWPYAGHYTKPHAHGTANLLTPESIRRYSKYFGADHYSFETKTCRFIVINDQLCNSGYPEDLAQMKWLEETLATPTKAKRTFLLMHDPLFIRAPDEISLAKEPLNTIARHANKLDVVYTGHIHRDYANWYKDTYAHGLNSTTWNFPWLTYAGTQRPISSLAQMYDPYKVGYLVVRIRDGIFHESWVPLYWQLPDPPGELAKVLGARIISRPATEVEDSVLGIAAIPPTPHRRREERTFSEGIATRDNIVCDQWWRLAENIGSKWLQVCQGPTQSDYWSDLERALTLGRPRGVKIAVPVHAERTAMEEEWRRMEPYAKAISAVMVYNGMSHLTPPTVTNSRLTGWSVKGNANDWAEACERARKLVPNPIKIVLSRLPLLGVGAMDRINETAAALKGKADVLAVWMATQDAPGKLSNQIAAAAEIARSQGLELWLDVAAWESVEEPLRSAYFLRLLAICQANKIKVFWWNGPHDDAGLLDGFWNPTPLYFAAQAWQTITNPPAEVVKLAMGEITQMKWQDKLGQEYLVWWKESDNHAVGSAGRALSLPTQALLADPAYGRLLQLGPSDPVPLCNRPLIARTGLSERK